MTFLFPFLQYFAARSVTVVRNAWSHFPTGYISNLKDGSTASMISTCCMPLAATSAVRSFPILPLIEANLVWSFLWLINADEFIVGRVIKAMNANWHPECFRCELCNKELADIGFLRNSGRYFSKHRLPTYWVFFSDERGRAKVSWRFGNCIPATYFWWDKRKIILNIRSVILRCHLSIYAFLLTCKLWSRHVRPFFYLKILPRLVTCTISFNTPVFVASIPALLSYFLPANFLLFAKMLCTAIETGDNLGGNFYSQNLPTKTHCVHQSRGTRCQLFCFYTWISTSYPSYWNFPLFGWD